MEATGGHGADVILDIIGACYLASNLAALAPDGRIANIGLQQGRRAELDFGALMAKRGTIMSTTLRARPAEQKASHRRGGDGRERLAARRRGRDPARHRHGSCPCAGGRGAPDHDRLHPHGQDRAARRSHVRRTR